MHNQYRERLSANEGYKGQETRPFVIIRPLDLSCFFNSKSYMFYLTLFIEIKRKKMIWLLNDTKFSDSIDI